MPTPNELRQAIVEGRADLQEAFHAAHDAWERKPPSGAGEDAWSPRQTAEHIVGSEIFFASMIGVACGAPALERQPLELLSPAAAAAAHVRNAARADAYFRHVSEGDLSKEGTHPRLGQLTVQALLEMHIGHLHNHANQIREACK